MGKNTKATALLIQFYKYPENNFFNPFAFPVDTFGWQAENVCSQMKADK